MVRTLILPPHLQKQPPTHHYREYTTAKSQFSSLSDCSNLNSNCSSAASSSNNSFSTPHTHPTTIMTIGIPMNLNFANLSPSILLSTFLDLDRKQLESPVEDRGPGSSSPTKITQGSSNNYLQIPTLGGRDLPKSASHNLVYTPFSVSIANFSCSTPNSSQASGIDLMILIQIDHICVNKFPDGYYF